ncbi:MAG: hypothetical protein M3R02_18105 [Chloroflexota bacterium]|nr:hypothetical protein [Chloroflexota bacterium]
MREQTVGFPSLLGGAPAAPGQTTPEPPAVEPEAVISEGIEVGSDIVRVMTQLLLIVTMAASLLVDGEPVFSWVAWTCRRHARSSFAARRPRSAES